MTQKCEMFATVLADFFVYRPRSFLFLIAIAAIFSGENVSFAARSDTSSSFVFVIDTTGSMAEELDRVKDECLRILSAIEDDGANTTTDLIFVPFNDPGIGPILRTHNIDEFKTKLREIQAEGGGDCPEMSLSGIREALNVSLPKSTLFVFTDASPKDGHLLPDVLSLIRLKQSQVLFFLTDAYLCSIKDSPPAYEKIASVGVGQIFYLEKMDVSKVMDYIRYTGESQSEKLLAVDAEPTSNEMDKPRSYECPIDQTISDLTVSLSGKGTHFTLTDSKGNDVQQLSNVSSLVDLASLKILRIMNPQFKNLVVNVTSSNRYSLRLTGVSSLSFLYGFSLTNKWSRFMNEFSALPFKDSMNYLYLKPILQGNYSVAPDVIPKFCYLTSSNGEVLHTVALSPIENSVNDAYFGSFSSENVKKEFFLQVHGETKHGSSFQRVVSPSLQPDAQALVVSIPENQILYLSTTSTLKCHVESTQPYNARWLKNGTALKTTKLLNHTGDYLLEVLGVSSKDEGNYSCLISQSDLTIERWTYIVVSSNSRKLMSNHVSIFVIFTTLYSILSR